MQLVLPVHFWNVPNSHRTHVCVPAFLCASLLYWPGVQTEHVAEPATANCPSMQRLHPAAFTVPE